MFSFPASRRLLFDECGLERPIDTYDPDWYTTSIIVIVMENLMFVTRLAARFSGLGTWGWDDTSCVIAYVCSHHGPLLPRR